MFIRLNLQNGLTRRVFFLTVLVTLGLLVKIIIGEFVVGTLSDKRVGASKDLLISATGYFPSSARLFSRLGETEASESNAGLESAETSISQAVKLSPNNYRFRLLLAEIRDSRGEQAAAEQSFRDALKLAPNYSEVHWKFANFLARANRIEDSIEHFRIAANLNPTLFAATLDLIWMISDKNIPFLKQIVKDDQKAQLKLALLLANQSRIPEAAEIFSKLDKNITQTSWESSSFLDALIKKGFSKLAFDLWLQTRSVEGETTSRSLIWNGDFEMENDSVSTQFDWRLGKSDYARIGLDSSEKHSGMRSLLIDFSGRDTAKLDNEVKHLVAARAGINYRLDFFVKTEEFKTAEGPRVVISDLSGKLIARSETVPAGNNDWQRMSINFPAPQGAGDSAALIISVKRQPRYSYDEPTRGRIWFDDFVINEVNGK